LKTESLLKRYSYKLSTNFTTFVTNIAVQAIVPRALGPGNYGVFHFLYSFFQQLTSFMELGTSQAYVTKLSKRQKEKGLITFYFLFILVMILLIWVLMTGFHFTGLYRIIWPGQQVKFIYYAASCGVLFWLSNILIQTSDVLGFTRKTEFIRISQKVVSFGVVLFLYYNDKLSLENFFIYTQLMLALLTGTLLLSILGNREFSIKQFLFIPDIKNYFSEFYQFSRPLFILGLVGSGVFIADRWMLQVFYGNEEQGFYGLAFQLSYVCLLFSTAMTPLITREFSIATQNLDIKKLSKLFRDYIPPIFSFVSYISCFVAMNSGGVIRLFAGDAYINANWVVMIMSLYPIHQVYGQLGGAIFMATGKTDLYMRIGLYTLLPGLILTFILIAPSSFFGLELGGAGLAMKMVFIQVIAVNIRLFITSRMLHLRFSKYFLHQLGVIGFFILIAFISKPLSKYFFCDYSWIIHFFMNGFLYTVIILGLGIIFPPIFGVRNKTRILKLFNKIKDNPSNLKH